MKISSTVAKRISPVLDKATSFYDVIVIGGGHAGTEAAAAATRMGAKVALVTHKWGTVGALSCNPSIGGIGKGHLVREIDALHGVMPRAADRASIQFRTLNASRGAAVQGPRAQVDRQLYRDAIHDILTDSEHNKLTVIEGNAKQFLFQHIHGNGTENENYQIKGITLQDANSNVHDIKAASVILTTGTFLNGKMHIGKQIQIGGRRNDIASIDITNALYNLGFQLGRMKTGTPPRIYKNSIDFTNLAIEESDKHPMYFSFLATDDDDDDDDKNNGQQQSTQWNRNRDFIKCYQTKTTKQTHDIIRKALQLKDEVPDNMCQNGPRYCPSLESKVERFGDRNGHIVWLEPEGLHSDFVYPAGISMSVSEHVQQQVIQSIPGMHHAQIAIPGYAVEYDFVNPQELKSNMETFRIGGLFLAGQINGTTGYEEAASQGIIAGINATLHAGNENNNNEKNQELNITDCSSSSSSSSSSVDSDIDYVKNDVEYSRQLLKTGALHLGRDDAYTGVLLDDLTKLGTSEPYRMLTSRAEYRVLLRADNADVRLTSVGRLAGCVPSSRWRTYCKKREVVMNATNTLKAARYSREEWEQRGLAHAFDGCTKTSKDSKFNGWTLLGRTNVNIFEMSDALNVPAVRKVVRQREIARHVEAECKYEPHVVKQRKNVLRTGRDEGLEVGPNFDYQSVVGLSLEDYEKLSQVKPSCLGDAKRIAGVSAAAIDLMRIHIRRQANRNSAA